MKSAFALDYGGCFVIEEPMCIVETSNSSDVTDEDEALLSNGEGSAKESDRERTWSDANRFKRSSDEYRRRRQRNNMAVKKSRDKAKQRQRERARHLELLTAENKKLHMKAEVLMKELNLLKGLFPVVGLSPPPEIDSFLLGN